MPRLSVEQLDDIRKRLAENRWKNSAWWADVEVLLAELEFRQFALVALVERWERDNAYDPHEDQGIAAYLQGVLRCSGELRAVLRAQDGR